MNNLLIWSQSQKKGIVTKPQAVNATAIIQEVIDLLKQQWQSKELQIDFESFDEMIWIDPDHFKAVMRNLLSNAIKFSKKKHSIAISHSIHNKELSISIRDTGMGMPKEQLAFLFTAEEIKSTPWYR
jgi:signal transduction histidine kinase